MCTHHTTTLVCIYINSAYLCRFKVCGNVVLSIVPASSSGVSSCSVTLPFWHQEVELVAYEQCTNILYTCTCTLYLHMYMYIHIYMYMYMYMYMYCRCTVHCIYPDSCVRQLEHIIMHANFSCNKLCCLVSPTQSSDRAVEVASSEETVLTVSTDPDGQFCCMLQPGHYTLTVHT